MGRDEETLACALMVERQHGERAAIHVAEQIGRLAMEEDQAGIAWWQQIASILDQRARQH